MTEKFNQKKYVEQWTKDNMLNVSAKFKSDFVLEFRESLKLLNMKQSDCFRNAMQEVIEKAKRLPQE